MQTKKQISDLYDMYILIPFHLILSRRLILFVKSHLKFDGCFQGGLGVRSIRVLAKTWPIPIMNTLSWFMI